jgi:hypothetical protein
MLESFASCRHYKFVPGLVLLRAHNERILAIASSSNDCSRPLSIRKSHESHWVLTYYLVRKTSGLSYASFNYSFL